MIKTKMVVFTTREEVEKVPGLVKLLADDGQMYSTFKPLQYPLGESISISYEEVVSGRNKQFKQNRLVDKASPAVVQGFKDGAARASGIVPVERGDAVDVLTLCKAILHGQELILKKLDSVLENQNYM